MKRPVNPKGARRKPDRGQSARAFWTTGPGTGELRTEKLPAVGEGELLVQTLYSGISRGTESLVFLGHVPVSEHQRMRCPHQAGEFPAPVKYGYSSVGRVAAGPSPWLGQTVFCLHPHQTSYVVPASDAHPLPAGVPPARALLAANLETAINVVWDAGIRLGDRVSVVGAGTLGCLCAFLAGGFPAAGVELVDVLPERARTAAALGVGFALPGAALRERDLVLHASGTEAGLHAALELAGHEGTIVELSWYGDAVVRLPLGADFHARRLSLRSSQVGSLSPRAPRRFTRELRLDLALALCADARLDCLLDGETPFGSLPRTMARLCRPGATSLCHRVRYL